MLYGETVYGYRKWISHARRHAAGFIDQGPTREISFIPEIATKECWDCKECFPLCPTSAIQAAYVLMKALAPTPTSTPALVEG